jgi:hypothetical protein
MRLPHLSSIAGMMAGDDDAPTGTHVDLSRSGLKVLPDRPK